MEDILRAIALGVIQGLTEFLPISSSGHLIVARELFGWEFADDLTFDVALHLGTTAAVIAYFWSEWLKMLRSGWDWLFTREPVEPGTRNREPEFSRSAADREQVYDARLLVLLVIGSVPAGITGLIFDLFLEDEVRSPIVVGAMLIVFGLVLYVAERLKRGTRDVASTEPRDAASIGMAQAVSLVPGVSRSGVTISAAMARGYSREQAARLSFLLATPAILGAGLLKCAEGVVDGVPAGDIDAIAAGTVVSAVVGWLSIRYLLRWVQRGTFTGFVVYRLVAGALILVYFSA
jgi:undecaprenyl-diphosphatase